MRPADHLPRSLPRRPSALLGALLLTLLPIGGCATIDTLHRSDHGAPLVYGGTRLNLDALGQRRRAAPPAPELAALDLPFSAALDTVLLPYTLGAAMSRAVTGGPGR